MGASVLISLALVIAHILQYREPVLQRYTIRIVLMIPTFALSSFVSLVAPDASFYVTTIRDVYEASPTLKTSLELAS